MKILLALMVISGTASLGQNTGVSHPEETVVVTTDGVQQPMSYIREPVIVTHSSVASVPSVPQSVAPNGYVSTPSNISPERPASTASQAVASTPEDVDAGIVTSVPGAANEISEGMLLRVRLKDALTTEQTKAGTNFSGELTRAVERDGRVLLPAGSVVAGRVTEVNGGRRIAGGAAIHLTPLSVTLPDGVRYLVQAQVVDTDRDHNIKVDSEGTMLRRGHAKETLAVLGLAAGGGAAAGGLVGGPGGALIGAGIGAGLGTIVWLKEDRQEEIPAGTEIVLSLNAPLFVGQP